MTHFGDSPEADTGPSLKFINIWPGPFSAPIVRFTMRLGGFFRLQVFISPSAVSRSYGCSQIRLNRFNRPSIVPCPFICLCFFPVSQPASSPFGPPGGQYGLLPACFEFKCGEIASDWGSCRMRQSMADDSPIISIFHRSCRLEGSEYRHSGLYTPFS